MIYRIKMNLAFPSTATLSDLQKVRGLLAPVFRNSVVINEGLANEERGFILLEECYHDESAPCIILERWETGRGRVFP